MARRHLPTAAAWAAAAWAAAEAARRRLPTAGASAAEGGKDPGRRVEAAVGEEASRSRNRLFVLQLWTVPVLQHPILAGRWACRVGTVRGIPIEDGGVKQDTTALEYVQ